MTDQPLPSLQCPLCGGPNDCAPAGCGRFDVDCWCTQASFPAELLAQVPAELRDKACICPACVAKAWQAQKAAGQAPRE